MKVFICDNGEESVGIPPSQIVVDAEGYDVKDFTDDREAIRKRYKDFFEEEFDLLGTYVRFDDEDENEEAIHV